MPSSPEEKRQRVFGFHQTTPEIAHPEASSQVILSRTSKPVGDWIAPRAVPLSLRRCGVPPRFCCVRRKTATTSARLRQCSHASSVPAVRQSSPTKRATTKHFSNAPLVVPSPCRSGRLLASTAALWLVPCLRPISPHHNRSPGSKTPRLRRRSRCLAPSTPMSLQNRRHPSIASILSSPELQGSSLASWSGRWQLCRCRLIPPRAGTAKPSSPQGTAQVSTSVWISASTKI